MSEASDSLTFWDPTMVTCLFFMGVSVLTYDYFCTLEQEVAFAWPCPPSFGLFLFYLNRYLPFIDQSVSIYLRLSINSPETCSRFTKWALWFIFFGIFISQLIITLRTCAIWGVRRRVTIPLAGLTLGTAVFFVSQMALQMNSLKFAGVEGRGCRIKPGPGKFIDVVFVPNFISDCVAITLTTIKAYQHFRLSSSSWLNQFYRDGILYCAFILVLGLINVVSPTFSVPLYYKTIMHSPTRIFHSIFCNRVMLLILEQRHDLSRGEKQPETTSFGGETMQIFSTVQVETITPDCTEHISMGRGPDVSC